MNIGDVIVDYVTSHGVDLQRFNAYTRRRALRTLQKVEAELVAALAKFDPTIGKPNFRRDRLRKLLEQTRETIRGGYKTMRDDHADDLRDLSSLETDFALLSINQPVAVELASVALSPAQVKAISSNVLIEGAPSKDWWARQAGDLEFRFTDQIRTGMMIGEPLGDLVRRIRGTQENGFNDGIMSISTRSAEALIRTSVQTVANSARIETYRANDDVVKGIQWVSTLDTRTTPICVALNAKVWDLDLQPVGHNQPFPGPTAHWNCRSTQISVLKDWEELSENGFKVPKPSEKRINEEFKKNLAALGFSEEDAAKIRRDGRSSKYGQVAKELSFNDWLKKRSVTDQNELLGPTKAQMWREGKITLGDLIDQRNRPLTIEQLKEKIRRRG